MNPEYLIQTRSGRTYTELFEEALQKAEYTKFFAAVAYATISGVRTLERTLEAQPAWRWNGMRKQWLVGIDWCRSDPPALARLATLPRSKVRVPNGSELVARADCVPRDTFHPKLFIFVGAETTAIISGSGNLSANGLTRGCECGSLFMGPTQNQAMNLMQWFETAWRASDAYESLRTPYEAACRKRVKQKTTVPTEDDTIPPQPAGRRRRKGLSEEQIRQLRSFDHFWIEAGALGANLGPGIPGNQLDMTRYTRVFFGAPADDVEPNEEIDDVTLVWSDETFSGRTLKFGDNGMDKLNVPPAGIRGPLFYRSKTLLFSRKDDGTFEFEVGEEADKRRWKTLSRRSGATYAMPRGREWGLF